MRKKLVEKLQLKYGWSTNDEDSLTLVQLKQLTIDELRDYAAMLEQEDMNGIVYVPATAQGDPIYDGVED